MKILAIDTSCDETAAAVTEGVIVRSNVIWSQVALHQEWGGVVPSIAKQAHQEKLDEVIKKALQRGKTNKPEAVAVTVGPGLAIALEIGILKAKELASKWEVPIIAVNHVEGHLLSPLSMAGERKQEINFPAWGIVVSGGHTELVFIKEIGDYQIIASMQDDALGEALDKVARMLGLGYPGGAFLEKLAAKGKTDTYPLPLPMRGREDQGKFSYSGIKTAMWQLVEKIKKENGCLNKKQTEDLAASFQKIAFEHLIRVVKKTVEKNNWEAKNLLVGGGVSANKKLRIELRKLGKELNLKVCFPLTKKLCGDNAAMIGVAAGFKAEKGELIAEKDFEKVDRMPRMKVDQNFEI
jgi:N6-L-threonylcarbamoyladenine synthase